MDSIDRAGPARLRTNELPRQKSPEVCARQRADRARLESRLTRSARRRRSNTRGTSAAGRGLLDRATALALRTSERLASQRKHQRIASTQTRDEQVHGGTCAHDTAHTSVVLAARDSRTSHPHCCHLDTQPYHQASKPPARRVDSAVPAAAGIERNVSSAPHRVTKQCLHKSNVAAHLRHWLIAHR